MSDKLTDARRVLKMSDWILDQLEQDDAPEHDLGIFLAACMTHLLGMSLPWEQHTGESLERLEERAQHALEVGAMS